MNRSTSIGKAWLGAALAVIALICVRPALAQMGVVSITGGRVAGVRSGAVTAFKGIPFAAPPLGDLRWRLPQPVKPWSATLQADHFGPPCMQGGRRPGASSSASEDCLYLNVWTAAKSKEARLPVMVWIYGGAYTGGSASLPAYDGTHFAEKGVVLVSFNYRLGAFGFLADQDLAAESPHHVSGNYGLADMIAALRWVKANIGRFGGDASRVTIFGESAGAMSVGILSVSPAARGLFQRAISESGGAPLLPVKPAGESYTAEAAFLSLRSAEDRGRGFLTQLGVQDIAAARKLPAEAILKAQTGIGPVYDGYFVPADAYQRFRAGHFNDTPILVGTNANEGGFRPIRAEFAGTTPEKFEAHVRAAYGQYADQILAAYPHATAPQAEQASQDLFFRETAFAWKSWTWSRLQSEKGHGKAYLYYFDRRSSQEPFGPIHTEEIPFVFGNVGQTPPRGFEPPGPLSAADVRLSQQIQSYWVNFAKTGDPNGQDLPRWPAFSASSQQAMYLDADPAPHAGLVPNLNQLTVLDAYFRWLRDAQPKQRPN